MAFSAVRNGSRNHLQYFFHLVKFCFVLPLYVLKGNLSLLWQYVCFFQGTYLQLEVFGSGALDLRTSGDILLADLQLLQRSRQQRSLEVPNGQMLLVSLQIIAPKKAVGYLPQNIQPPPAYLSRPLWSFTNDLKPRQGRWLCGICISAERLRLLCRLRLVVPWKRWKCMCTWRVERAALLRCRRSQVSQLFSGTLVPFFLAAPLKMVFPKKGSLFFQGH